MKKKTIEVYWDPMGTRGGQLGCWRARLLARPGIHDAGITEEEAIENLLTTAKTFGESDEKDDYVIIKN